ncbi:MAG: hypothetical protein ACXAE3_18010 [Candidatus Kariarchaeaceae archaeon]|jgi:hypothetical protein
MAEGEKWNYFYYDSNYYRSKAKLRDGAYALAQTLERYEDRSESWVENTHGVSALVFQGQDISEADAIAQLGLESDT